MTTIGRGGTSRSLRILPPSRDMWLFVSSIRREYKNSSYVSGQLYSTLSANSGILLNSDRPRQCRVLDHAVFQAARFCMSRPGAVVLTRYTLPPSLSGWHRARSPGSQARMMCPRCGLSVLVNFAVKFCPSASDSIINSSLPYHA